MEPWYPVDAGAFLFFERNEAMRLKFIKRNKMTYEVLDGEESRASLAFETNYTDKKHWVLDRHHTYGWLFESWELREIADFLDELNGSENR